MRKNEEFREKRLGQLERSMGNAIPKQGKGESTVQSKPIFN
jgi:hypothetical protein